MTGVSYLICFSFLVLFDFPSSFLVFSRQSFLCVSTCWWSGKPLGSLTRFFFVPLAFHPPPPQPSPCLFVCLPFFVYSIRIPAGYTTSLGVCVCMCFFSSLLLLLYPFVLWANFHKLFVVRRCGILFIDERRWGWAKLYTVHQQQPSKFSPEKKKIICQMRRRESSILQNLI